MFSRIAQFIKVPVTLITTVVVVFGFMCVGMFSKASMDMPGMGMVSGDHMPTCCTMGVQHHVDSWKNIIVVAPDKIRDSLIVLAFALALVFGCSWVSLRHRLYLPDPDHTRLRLYLKQNPDLLLFNHLKLAFARGILNTKVY